MIAHLRADRLRLTCGKGRKPGRKLCASTHELRFSGLRIQRICTQSLRYFRFACNREPGKGARRTVTAK
jgi:hypothetical protein